MVLDLIEEQVAYDIIVSLNDHDRAAVEAKLADCHSLSGVHALLLREHPERAGQIHAYAHTLLDRIASDAHA
jgi:hypothetical protein